MTSLGFLCWLKSIFRIVVCVGCAFKWCEYTPAVKPAQFYLSYAINSISFPYNIAICQAMFR